MFKITEKRTKQAELEERYIKARLSPIVTVLLMLLFIIRILSKDNFDISALMEDVIPYIVLKTIF